MPLDSLRSLHLAMRSRFRTVRGWLPLFEIWAAQWFLNGALQWYGSWKLPDWVPSASALLAAAASIAVLLGSGTAPASSDTPVPPALRMVSFLAVIPFSVAAGSILLLEYERAVDPFFLDLARALLLSFFFSCLGLLLGVELILLSVWLFLVCTVTFIWYLGFGPMVVDLMGGMSLLAGGRILRVWTSEGKDAV